ncbi:MAG: hypothetical protein CMJ18_01515 [Phycisphaeraceae bacterium]|nr:hypothetical protein [Phycisphaeraceae bacterium]
MARSYCRFVEFTVLLICCGAMACCSAAQRRAKPLVLVEDGRPRAVIVTADEPTPVARESAAAMQQIVSQMTGAIVPIQPESQYEGERVAVLVGGSKLADRVGTHVQQDRDGEGDRYLIRTGGNYVALVGNDHLELRGTAYAVYDLLQRTGCGWFGPDPVWHVIPKRKTLAVPPLDIDVRPAFEYRHLWLAQQHKALRDAWRLGGKAGHTGGPETLFQIVPPEQYRKDHPDYFGKGQPCLTHPDVIDIVTADLRARIARQRPHMALLSVGQMDNENFCECDRCQAVGNVSARMVHFANRVARELDGTNRGQFTVQFLAHWTVHDPPNPAIKLHPAVSVVMVNEGDHVHPWDEPEPIEVAETTDRNNTREITAFAGWRQTGALEGIWEWWIPACEDKNWATVPWYSGQTHLRNLRYWKRGGIRYVFYETNYERGTGFPLRWPLYYVAARGLWDTTLTSDQIMTEACNKLYGPAANSMLRFYQVIEKAMIDSELTGRNWDLPSPEAIYTPDIESRAAEHLVQAAEATSDPAILARIADEQEMWNRARDTLTRLRDASKQ